MAYAALVSLERTIDQILKRDHYSIFLRDKEKITSLDKYVIVLQAFLENFPEKANSLEGRIRDAATEAEDLIEYFMFEILSRDEWISWTLELSRVKFAHQLKKVTGQIDSIAAEVMDIKNSFKIKDVGVGVTDFSAASPSSGLEHYTGKVAMVGFEEDLMAIKYRLCGESSKRQVIPIVGMGGIGKTTLARNAFDDPLIMEHFHIRAWVTVSEYSSAQEILSHLLDSMKEFNARRSGQSDAENVYKTLKGRRYLIVMDDIWRTETWDVVKMLLPDDANGSRVMLTTRLSDVAAYADSSSSPHEMRFMDANQSWNLLRHKVFVHDDCPPELVHIGMEIARMCRGLPLAIVVIAGLLSTANKTQDSWEKIAENVSSAVATKDEQFDKILSLSYTHLPHYLKPCFLYMGGFPKDHEIRVSKLMKLWVAEGFLKLQSGPKSLEDEAEEYLEDLVRRSLVLVAKRKSNGKIKSCSLHDLMRDLCVRKSNEEKFLLHVMHRHILPKTMMDQRRITIAHSDLNCLASIYGSSIPTILCFQNNASNSVLCLRKFRLLRVLRLVIDYGYTSFTEVYVRPPDKLFELFHLKYLALYYCQGIPASIINLQNLETLIILPAAMINWWDELAITYLPSEIWRMPKLRHILFSDLGHINVPSEASFVLKNLESFSVVDNLYCEERILKMMPNLKKLGIFCSSGSHIKDYQLQNLVYLHQLEKLKLEHHYSFGGKHTLVLPRTLKRLTLIRIKLAWKHMRAIGSLRNLEVLKLRNDACVVDKWETKEGEFPCLTYLQIEKSDLEHWITGSSHFPRLKCLLLHSCRRLREIPEGIADIPTLELIEVKGKNKSLMESVKQVQEEQRSYGNDSLEVRIPELYQ